MLVWNVCDGWEPLCKFLDKDLPNEPFPQLNKGWFQKEIATTVFANGSRTGLYSDFTMYESLKVEWGWKGKFRSDVDRSSIYDWRRKDPTAKHFVFKSHSSTLHCSIYNHFIIKSLCFKNNSKSPKLALNHNIIFQIFYCSLWLQHLFSCSLHACFDSSTSDANIPPFSISACGESYSAILPFSSAEKW